MKLSLPGHQAPEAGLTLPILISMLTTFQTEDPRDAIYALIPLVKDARNSSVFSVNNSKSPSRVFTEFIADEVEKGKSLDIICRPWAPDSAKRPSYISQLSKFPFRSNTNYQYTRVNADSLVGPPSDSPYNASKGSQPDVHFIFNMPYYIMAVKGFHIDSVSSYSRFAFNGIIPSGWQVMALESNAVRLENGLLIQGPETLWRTMVADCGPKGDITLACYQEACRFCYENTGTGDLNTEEMKQFLIDRDEEFVSMIAFLTRVQSVCWNRRLACTAESNLALVPEKTSNSDLVCVLLGCSVPVLLRREYGGYYRFIGECYYQSKEDVMNGGDMTEINLAHPEVVKIR